MNAKLAVMWLLSVCESVPCAETIYRAIDAYDDPVELYNETNYDDDVFTPKDISRLSDKNTKRAEELCEYCDSHSIDIITYYDNDYPEKLRNIIRPPAALFVKGTLPNIDITPSVAIIGTRECSPVGQKFAASASYALSHSGFVVVSGMARGIDTFAHKGALLAEKPTVAVIPCGADIIYPPQNKELYSRIIECGAVVSEYLPGTKCKPYFFRMRNRLISGLADSVLVVESDIQGGSMITVGHALEQGRTVFAVPGTPGVQTSAGTNSLLRTGAMICSSPQDIIDEYNTSHGTDIKLSVPKRKKVEAEVVSDVQIKEKTYETAPSNEKSIYGEPTKSASAGVLSHVDAALPPEFANQTEKDVWNIFEANIYSVDDICALTGLSFPVAIHTLEALELKGALQAMPGGYYKRK